MKIIVASNNKNKIKEIQNVLSNCDIELLSLSDVLFNKDINETGNTFEENAYIKAKTIYNLYHLPVISDDSGLVCVGLNGKPGIYSHRYAGENATDEDNNKKLVSDLKNITNRNAYFKCVICYINKEGKESYLDGIINGKIIDTPKGNNGFGYDPYFYVESLGKTLAELDITEKNLISHRAIALNKLKDIIYENSIN